MLRPTGSEDVPATVKGVVAEEVEKTEKERPGSSHGTVLDTNTIAFEDY